MMRDQTAYAAPSQNATILDFTYAFNHGSANNGNVTQIVNNITPDRTQNFAYDELNRIRTAATQATSGTHAWGLTFGYDVWANLLSASQITGVSGLDYDAAGNLWHEPGRTYTYDAENRMKNAVGVDYFYDGDGKRVKKDQTGGSTYDKLHWYGLSADPMLESDLSGTVTDEYIFFPTIVLGAGGGKHWNLVRDQEVGGSNHSSLDLMAAPLSPAPHTQFGLYWYFGWVTSPV